MNTLKQQLDRTRVATAARFENTACEEAFSERKDIDIKALRVKAHLVANLAHNALPKPEEDLFGLIESINALVADLDRLADG